MSEELKLLNSLFIEVAKIATFSLIIPILVGTIKWKDFNKPLKVILLFCILSLFNALIEQVFYWSTTNYKTFWVPYLNKWNIHNTIFLSILALVTEITLLSWYFSLTIPNQKIKRIIRLVSIGLLLSVIINYLFYEGFRVPSVFNDSAVGIFCFTLPLIHLKVLYHLDSKVVITKNPYFWIALGLVVYYLIGFFLDFAGKTVFETDRALFYKISIADNLVYIIGNLFMAIGFYYARYVKYLPQTQ